MIKYFSAILIVASVSANLMSKDEVKYKTSFGYCPSRAAGKFTLKLVKNFEEKKSLRSMKKVIHSDRLKEKHFISDYKIKHDPIDGTLSFRFNCPKPLMKVQIYKDNGLESYEAILVDNGMLYDPTYEVLLRGEKKLDYDLPFLAIPVGEMEKDVQEKITTIVGSMDLAFRKKLSEVIVNDSKELTMILSIKGSPSSVFMGKGEWDKKVNKLTKIVSYMSSKRRIPAVINLTNPKKVVVKFNQ
ncbi:MAG: hypothetical protein CME69_07430 [Halobacteriovorax sp.]|nr:hypothetical protein [Halobacteriovorax sp.]MEE3079479.1 hypothetical protein [Bdellovibrionota bacterium]